MPGKKERRLLGKVRGRGIVAAIFASLLIVAGAAYAYQSDRLRELVGIERQPALDSGDVSGGEADGRRSSASGAGVVPGQAVAQQQAGQAKESPASAKVPPSEEDVQAEIAWATATFKGNRRLLELDQQYRKGVAQREDRRNYRFIYHKGSRITYFYYYPFLSRTGQWLRQPEGKKMQRVAGKQLSPKKLKKLPQRQPKTWLSWARMTWPGKGAAPLKAFQIKKNFIVFKSNEAGYNGAKIIFKFKMDPKAFKKGRVWYVNPGNGWLILTPKGPQPIGGGGGAAPAATGSGGPARSAPSAPAQSQSSQAAQAQRPPTRPPNWQNSSSGSSGAGQPSGSAPSPSSSAPSSSGGGGGWGGSLPSNYNTK